MAGLPCTVAAVLVLAVLGTAADQYVCQTPWSLGIWNKVPEKCDNVVDTGSQMSNEERQSAVKAVNLYRSFIANQCDKFKSGTPKSANFRKIRYSCELEQQVKFDCYDVKNTIWTTNGAIFRRAVDPNKYPEHSIFYQIAPWLEHIGIDDRTQDYVDSRVNGADTLRFYLNENAAEIGCFSKICYSKIFFACTNGNVIPERGPLYTAGTRCQSNEHCKDPDYPVCDKEFGLCEEEKHQCDNKNKFFPACGHFCTPWPSMPVLKNKFDYEKCDNVVHTGSAMNNEERQSSVTLINLYRSFVARQCILFEFLEQKTLFPTGKPPSANFRKIRYSCELEQQVKFDCSGQEAEFKTSGAVFRTVHNFEYDSKASIFFETAPVFDQESLSWQVSQHLKTLRFFFNGDADEIGCFASNCETRCFSNNRCYGKIFLACTTGKVIPESGPLYTAGTRCLSNRDCKDPGHPICDKELGLCEEGKLPFRCGKPKNPPARLAKEVCQDSHRRLDTGSHMSNFERKTIVDLLNLYRGYIANECLNSDYIRPTANMLKISYSCELEDMAKDGFCPSLESMKKWLDLRWHSDHLFRGHDLLNKEDERTSLLWRLAPELRDIKEKYNEYDMKVAKKREAAAFAAFALKNDATEVGCFLNICHNVELIVCMTDATFYQPPTVPPPPSYKRGGKRCRSDSDCIYRTGYHTCDQEYGLCHI